MNFDVYILDEYHNAWNISSSKNNEELRSCEQKLIKLEIQELHKLLNPLKWAELQNLCDSDQIHKTCILLKLIHLFSIPGEEEQGEHEEEGEENDKDEEEEEEEDEGEEEDEDKEEGEEEDKEEEEDKDKEEEEEEDNDEEEDEDEEEDKDEEEEEEEDEEEEKVEEKIELVKDNLIEVLNNLSQKMIYSILDRFISQQLKFKSELTDNDLLVGQIDPLHEFHLKLYYWDTFLFKNDKESCIKFLLQNRNFLLNNIFKLGSVNEYNKEKCICCKIILCFMKWDIVNMVNIVQTTTVLLLNFTHTVKVGYLLQKIILTLSEDQIFEAFNDYLEQMYTMKSEITEDDFCTGKIEPHTGFLLKLCYCEKLLDENDDKTCKKFIRSNADFLVQHIEVVEWNKTKTKLISSKVLPCLFKWGISDQKTAWTLLLYFIRLKVNNNVCQSCMNENASFILSMIDIVMASKDVGAVINYCDVLFCIPYYKFSFYDVTVAVNKIIRDYAEPSRTHAKISEWSRIRVKISEWTIKLGYRILKHMNMQKLYSAKTIVQYLIEDLFADSCHDRIELALNQFSVNENSIQHQSYNCKYCMHTSDSSVDNTEGQDETRLKELWIHKIKYNLKAMKAWNTLAILNKKRIKGTKVSHINSTNVKPKYVLGGFSFLELMSKNEIPKKKFKPNVAISTNFIDEWEATLEEDQLDAKTMEDQINEIYMDEKLMKKLKLHELLVLLMMLLIVMVGTSTGHHKSAKLKKYLTLKYEYDTIILYLLWCSGDIEVHPGPTLKKKSLAHDSTIERRWIQNISQKLIIILPSSIQSKYKATKNRRNDRENREHFKALLKTCLEEKVHVPKMYLAEINAWETMEYHLLYKLFVYRCEIEAIIASIKDFVNFEGSTKDLTDINVSFNTKLKTNEIEMIFGKDQRPTDQSQLMVYITRYIAGISIKCAYGKDPDAKCDGLWDLPLTNWPKDITLFDPNNRGNYHKKLSGKKLISDQELVDILITLPQVTIPQKYTKIVDAYKLMRKSITKQHKADLCSTFKKSTSLEKIDYSLKSICKNGIFTKEVHNILSKWWTTRAVEIGDDQKLSQAVMDDGEKIERPHISMNISTAFISITVDPTIESSSHVKYDFPFNDDLVPLKTMATAVNQITIQLPSSDWKIPDANPADNQTDSITIPQEAMDKICSFISIDPIGHAIFKSDSDIKLQCKTSTQCPAFGSFTNLNQAISSTFKCSQSNQNIAIAGQPVPISCTHNQSTKTSDDIGHLSATKVSQNLDAHNQVSPTSDMGSSDSISTANSESEKEDSGQNNILKEGQVLMTDSDYSSDSSNNCVSKTSMKKRKCIEEDRNEMKKRIKPSLKQDKKQSETTNHIKIDSSTTSNKNMELLLDCLDIDLDLFDIDEQTFDVELNALDNEDKTLYISDKDKKNGNLENEETQILNENTNESVYKTNVSTELEKFLQDMINCEGEKMSQMKSYV